jgi:hypothetical protein
MADVDGLLEWVAATADASDDARYAISDRRVL